MLPLRCFTFLGLVLCSFAAQGYKEATHRVLTEAAASRSVLQLGPVLRDLGLTLDESTFPNSRNRPRNIIELLSDGAEFEDSWIRSPRHFYNPINGQGLFLFMSSPDWALALPDPAAEQQFSYWNARESFFKALTAPEGFMRKEAFGRMFETLGRVVHHLQDMAQPQHVRNDAHCEIPGCSYIVGSGLSRYELITNEREVLDTLPKDPPTGYNLTSLAFTSVFNSPRSFWMGQNPQNAGKGIAEFTNRNFVSYGTNFDKPGLFTSPVREMMTPEVDIQTTLCQGVDWCSNLEGNMTFFGNTVTDSFLGQSADTMNPFASSYSTFDQDLINRGGTPKFTLNRFNFQAAHSFLIPRAVAYSAGMINYFFRGRIDLVEDNSSRGTFLIKNLSSEPMSGTFSLYYDDTLDNRRLLTSWDRSIPANDQVNIGTIPADPTDPAPKNPGRFMLVFKGDMGAETTAEFGAVVGKDVTIPFWTFTDLGPIFAGGSFQITNESSIYIRGGQLSINDDGMVAGTTASMQAFLWSSGSGMQLLPGLPGGTTASFAYGINSSGSVAGSVFHQERGLQAALWFGMAGGQLLFPPPNPGDPDPLVVSIALGINGSSQVVGHFSTLNTGTQQLSPPRAFLWSSGSGIGLGALPGEANAINSSGQVVGYSFTPSGDPHAFLWSPGSGMQDLLTLPGGTSSVAYGISDFGQIVGSSTSSSGTRAFLWTSGTGMQDLMSPLLGFYEGVASGMNSRGQIVGCLGRPCDSGFFWSSAWGLQRLSWRPEVSATGWTAVVPTAINNAGQIVGWGYPTAGVVHGFLLSPLRR